MQDNILLNRSGRKKVVNPMMQSIPVSNTQMKRKRGPEDKGEVVVPVFAQRVLDSFRENCGRYRAETGGFLCSKSNSDRIDLCFFDERSRNTSDSFHYNVEYMTGVYRFWKEKGYTTNGIYHSHPRGITTPSFQDIETAYVHMRFFGISYFYLPILQSNPDGCYELYSYVCLRNGNYIEVSLVQVIRALEKGYSYPAFSQFKKMYDVKAFDAGSTESGYADKQEILPAAKEKKSRKKDPEALFSKVSGMYPENVLNKVLIFIGCGRSRGLIENFARCGFRNFLLIDGAMITSSDMAVSGIYMDEIGKKKTEAAKKAVMNINPKANVFCVNSNLDQTISDDVFWGYLKKFGRKKSTEYLFIACSGSFYIQSRSANLSLKYGIPYLASTMYEKGAAGEVIFTYPGVTASCPRCMLRRRYELYENGYMNDVNDCMCSAFAIERINSLVGNIGLMLLMYHDAKGLPNDEMLDRIKHRTFVQIRLDPDLSSHLNLSYMDNILNKVSAYCFMDETLWVPQTPDSPEYGEPPCLLCGGTGNLLSLKKKWKDTRVITYQGSSF